MKCSNFDQKIFLLSDLLTSKKWIQREWSERVFQTTEKFSVIFWWTMFSSFKRLLTETIHLSELKFFVKKISSHFHISPLSKETILSRLCPSTSASKLAGGNNIIHRWHFLTAQVQMFTFLLQFLVYFLIYFLLFSSRFLKSPGVNICHFGRWHRILRGEIH